MRCPAGHSGYGSTVHKLVMVSVGDVTKGASSPAVGDGLLCGLLCWLDTMR